MIILFSFDDGKEIIIHQSGNDAFVICLGGMGKIAIDGAEYELSPGQSIVMPADRPHTVYGKEQFQMLFVII